MTSLHSRAASGAGTAMRDLKWSPAEKAIARKAFDRALGRELEAVILETKSKAAKIQEPSDLGTAMRDLKWSPAEKAIARKAFDRALGRELEAVILETKSKAAKIQEPS